MFSKILSILFFCLSVNQIPSPFKVETPSLDTFNINPPTEPQLVNTPTGPKKIMPLLQKPVLEELENTNQKYIVKITNPNNGEVWAYIDNYRNGIVIQGNSYTIETFNWGENETTKDIIVYFKNDKGQTSDNSILTINRPRPIAPNVVLKSNTSNNFVLTITNNNNYKVGVYINENEEKALNANSTDDYSFDWVQNEPQTITLNVVFKQFNTALESTATSINVSRPTNQLAKPIINIENNVYESFKLKIYNPNNTNVYPIINGNNYSSIASNGYQIYNYEWENSTKTFYVSFTKPGGGYTDSETTTLTVNRPSEPHYITGTYSHYEYDPSNFTYTITINNTSPIATNYTDNLDNRLTIQANQTANINVRLTPNQDNLIINGTLEPATTSDYIATTIHFRLDNIAYIEVNNITRQKNGDITIKYQYAQPLNNNWNLEITDNINYNETINLNLVNTKDTITLKNQPNTKLYFNFKYKNEIITTENIPETQIKNTTEVIDIPGLMLLILTLPFSFISQAFNFTLFPGTQYAFNVSDILLTIIGALIIFYIIKMIIKMIKLL